MFYGILNEDSDDYWEDDFDYLKIEKERSKLIKEMEYYMSGMRKDIDKCSDTVKKMKLKSIYNKIDDLLTALMNPNITKTYQDVMNIAGKFHDLEYKFRSTK